MSCYVVFERTYVQNALIKGTLLDNSEFVTLVKQQQFEFKEKHEAADSRQASSVSDGQTASTSVLDLMENFSFILDKSCKRALLSLSIVNTCSMFNFINQILQEQFQDLFFVRFLIFSSLIKEEKYAANFGQLLGSKLHKIQNLFEVTEKCGFIPPSSGGAGGSTASDNLTNSCLIQTFNRFFHFTHNLEHLESQLREEFDNIIRNDLRIGDNEVKAKDSEQEQDHQQLHVADLLKDKAILK